MSEGFRLGSKYDFSRTWNKRGRERQKGDGIRKKKKCAKKDHVGGHIWTSEVKYQWLCSSQALNMWPEQPTPIGGGAADAGGDRGRAWLQGTRFTHSKKCVGSIGQGLM